MMRRLVGAASRWAWPASLVILPALFWWRIVFGGQVLAGVDLFTYFYPYRDYAASVLATGRLPLWNPYLFLGAPFLANSQVGVFYPLNLLLTWLPAPLAINWSIVANLTLAGAGAYVFCRRRLGMGRGGAWVAGLLFGCGGFLAAQAEHANQLAVSSLLPWALLLLDGGAARAGLPPARAPSPPEPSPPTPPPSLGEGRESKGGFRLPLSQTWERGAGGEGAAALGLLLGIAFLAGHSQAWYILVFGLGLYVVGLSAATLRRDGRRAWRSLWPAAGTLLVAVGLSLALSAVQLLPTLELAGQSIRAGGLPYREAASFSLKPTLLLRALLPGYGETVFSEYVAYVGVAGLGLAVAGALFGRRGKAWWLGVGAVLVGLFLAFGGYNPVYYVMYRLIPGFDIFRAPARWLLFYAFGVAVLAGMGADALRGAPHPRPLSQRVGEGGRKPALRTHPSPRLGGGAGGEGTQPAGEGGRKSALRTHPSPRLGGGAGGEGTERAPTRGRPYDRVARWVAGALILALLAGVALAFLGGAESLPSRTTLAGWAAALLALAGVIALARWQKAARLAPALIALLLLSELFIASRSLALARPTTWDAYASLRTAPAHLLAAGAPAPGLGDPTAHWGAGMPTTRFLSMSDTRFDPGDLAELRAAWDGRLGDDAFYDFVVATKQKEVLAPNLPLLYRIAAVDGYDGGLLPLERYVAMQSLLLRPDQILPDGRLREQLTEVPPARLLSLLNVEYVVTDKEFDVWIDDVFYDLQLGAVLGGDGPAVVAVETPAGFRATEIGVVSHLQGAAAAGQGEPVALLTWSDETGKLHEVPLRAGVETAEGIHGPDAAHVPAQVGRPWPDQEAGVDYVARLPLGEAQAVRDLRVTWLGGTGALSVRGITLVDGRTGAHRSLAVSSRGRFELVHSGDVKIYRNLDNLPRAYVVGRSRVVPADADAVAAMQDAGFEPGREVLLAEEPSPPTPPSLRSGQALSGQAGEGEQEWVAGEATLAEYSAEVVRVAVDAPAAGYLVLSDTWYPGWRAWVDGVETPVRRANVLFRAVVVPAGAHEVVFRYEPASVRAGGWISLAALALAVVVVAASRRR